MKIKKTSFADKDPFFKREKENYEMPLPSREYIMMVLEEAGCPLPRNALFKELGLDDEEMQNAIGFRLRAMLRDGQLMQDRRNRFCLVKNLNVLRGKVQGHPDGIGFFIPEDSSQEDMMLSPRQMREVMHGDIVLAYQSGVDRRGRPIGKVHEVVERVNVTVVGRFYSEHGVNYVVPDNKRLTQDISISPELTQGARPGQIVLVELLVYPSKDNQAIGKIIHVLGDHMAPGMEIEVAILAHGIPSTFPDDVLIEVGKVAQHVSDDEITGRADLRDLPFVTIDGEDAKDFDDAVFCKAKPKGGFLLYVAIADVSHYVPANSVLDREAKARGNSVYFPERVVPMLPEALSNGICSLNPKVDRLCMVAELSISASGKINRSCFYRAVIHSKARLTYTQVAKWLKDDVAEKEYQHLLPELKTLNSLYHALRENRIKRGAIEFDTTETQIVFDEHRKIERIVPVIRNDAHKIIEECMLAANVAVAIHLLKAEIPALFRVHSAPAPEKIVDLRNFLGEFGITLPGGKEPRSKDFQKTLDVVATRADKHLIETVMLRSLKQAAYLEVKNGHFGLAYNAYTHFTSPIRRYPDLIVHRALGHIIDKNEIKAFKYSVDDMNKLGKHCSQTERRADDATRDVISWLKCEYMQDKLGKKFSGRISAVTSFGIFVELDDIYAEGLVHVTSLQSDYYEYDAAKHRLLGTRGGKVYRLGDKMDVIVAQVNLDERKIDFEPVGEGLVDE